MRNNERIEDIQEAMRAVQDDLQGRIFTSIPAIVQSFDSETLTCTVKPAIKGIVQDQSLAERAVDLPVLVDVPVHYPAGGGYFMYFTLTAGDEVLVVFSARNIDNWFALGGVQAPADARQHSLSDGFAVPCVFSKAQTPSKPPLVATLATSTLEIGNNRGAFSSIKFTGSGTSQLVRIQCRQNIISIDNQGISIQDKFGGVISMTAAGTTMTSPSGEVSLAVSDSGIDITGSLSINGASWTTHRHSGVTAGGSNTGGVV